MQGLGIATAAAFERLAVDSDMPGCAAAAGKPAKVLGQGIAIERLKNIVISGVAWCRAASIAEALPASGRTRRPQRNMAIRSLAPASIAAIEIARIECNGICRPLRPRRSAILPSASHSGLVIRATSMLVAYTSNPICPALCPGWVRFFESPWGKFTARRRVGLVAGL